MGFKVLGLEGELASTVVGCQSRPRNLLDPLEVPHFPFPFLFFFESAFGLVPTEGGSSSTFSLFTKDSQFLDSIAGPGALHAQCYVIDLWQS